MVQKLIKRLKVKMPPARNRITPTRSPHNFHLFLILKNGHCFDTLDLFERKVKPYT